MEQRFGHDFSRVRVYSDREAEQSAQDVNANAYTVGQNIVFGAGRFAPATLEGRRLLAHELAHVAQQSDGSAVVLARQAAPKQDPNIALSRTLAKKLKDGKRDDVLRDLKKLKQRELEALEVAASQALALDKLQADALRRAIRFVLHDKPLGSPGGGFVVVVDSTHKARKKEAETTLAGGGMVTLSTGVSISGRGSNAYTLTYKNDKAADAAEVRWLQFAWREVVQKFPAKGKDKAREEPIKRTLTHSSRNYDLTTDSKKPNWNTDSGTTHSPFYEENTGAVNRSATELAMYDDPDPQGDPDLFKSTNPPERVISHFHAATYLIRGIDVVYRADIDLTWEFTSASKNPAKQSVTATGGPAKQLEAVQRARLESQDPDVDYLPAAPDKLSESGDFGAIQGLTPRDTSLTDAKWAAASDMTRYNDIVPIAQAGWVKEISGSSSINNATDPKADVKPGLNYSANLKTKDAAGETGYIDAKGVYHNPDLPIDKDGPLPRIAIILGPDAFKDKAKAVATLRHEMRHAAHAQLAIGWLLKWREEGSGKDFPGWLDAQHKKKKISDADYAIVSTGLPGVGLIATELPAHIEGMLAALPFLPPTPDLKQIATAKYPAAIDELRLLKTSRHDYVTGRPKPVDDLVLQRIHDFSCDVLVKSQRDALLAWIAFLLNPASLKPAKADKDDETAINLATNDFKSHQDFFKQIRDRVQVCK